MHPRPRIFSRLNDRRRTARARRSCGGLVAAILLAAGSRPAGRADDAIAYKYEDYRESAGRVAVQTQSSSADQDLGSDLHVKFTGTIDAISGATPTGQPAPTGSDQVPLTIFHERRKAWSGDLSGQFSRINLDVGYANSRESDYVSNGWSLNTLTDFNQKNTTLLLGVAGTDDRVEVFFEPAYLPKHTRDAIVGVTQLIDPRTFVTFDVSVSHATGYLGEPHKIVEKSVEILQGIFLPEAFSENRPDHRTKGTAFLALNRDFPAAHGAVEASYRFYADTFGVDASTVELSWFQRLGAKWILRPSLRFYDQSAADFYYYNLDDTSIQPVRIPTGTGPAYSSDFRLSAMETWSYGLKLVWNPAKAVSLDAAYERYSMRGRDGVTPQSAYPNAGIATAGVRISW